VSDLDNFIVKELEFDLESKDASTRRHALLSLAKLPPDYELMKLLCRVSEEDPVEELRYLAKKTHGELKADIQKDWLPPQHIASGDKFEQLVFKKLLAESSKEYKIAAILDAVKGKCSKALPEILDRLTQEEDTWVLATLVKAVGVLGESSNVPQVQSFLKHSDARVQANAIEALEMLGDELIFPLLAPMLNSKDNRIRANSINALMKYDRDEALATLDKMAQSSKTWMRDSAIYCLSIIDDPTAPSTALGMLQRETDGTLMKEEAELLAQHGRSEIIGQMAALAEKYGRDKAILLKYALDKIASRLGLDQAAVEKLATAHKKQTHKEQDSKEHRAKINERLEALRRGEDLPSSAESVGNSEKSLSEASPRWLLVAAAVSILLIGVFAGFHFLGQSPDTIVVATQPSFTSGKPQPAPDLGKAIAFTSRIRHIDRRLRTVLLNDRSNRQILCTFDERLPKDLAVSEKVTITGTISAHNRFGAVYVKVQRLDRR